MAELENYIKEFFSVSNDDIEKISTFFIKEELKKGDYFLKAGRYCEKLAFIKSGLVREFTIVGDKEVTKWICSEGYFIVDLSSFLFNKTARWNFQALNDCEIYTINQQNYQKIRQVIPTWSEIEKLFLAKCFTILEDRVISHLSMTAEERYNRLFNFNKAIFNQVPLQYIASMLGMKAETLSRIRNKQSKENS